MQGIELSWEKLSDSKEHYSNKPKPIMSIFIYGIFIMIAVGIIYSMLGTIEIVSVGAGVIRPNSKVSTVSAIVSGKVTDLSYRDGQEVLAGDTLFTIENTLDFQIEMIDKEINGLSFEILMNEKYIESITMQKNMFSDDYNDMEYEYHIRFVALQNRAKEIMNDNTLEINDLNINMERFGSNINELRDEIEMLKLFIESIDTGVNLLESNPKYQNIYQQYLFNLDRLKYSYEHSLNDIVTNNRGDELKDRLTNMELQLVNYNVLENSINNNQNYFSSDNSFGENYIEYESTYNQYALAVKRAENLYNGLLHSKKETEADYALAVTNENTIKAKLTNFNNSIVTQLNDSIYMMEEELLSQTDPDQIRLTETMIDDYRNFLLSIHDDTVYITLNTMLIHFQNELNNLEQEYIMAQKNSSSLSKQINELDFQIIDMNMQISTAKETLSAFHSKTMVQIQNNKKDLKERITATQFEIEKSGDVTEKKRDAETEFLMSIENLILENKINIDAQFEAKSRELKDLENTLESVYAKSEYIEMNTLENGDPLVFSSLWLNELITIYDLLDTKKKMLDALTVQEHNIREQIKSHEITAEIDGIINTHIEINNGDVVPANSPVATIIPKGESEHRVLLYINSKDIVGIEIGNTVKFEIPALPAQSYGNIIGQVVSISKDTKFNNNQMTDEYLVECTMPNKPLLDRRGNEANIEVGMTLFGRIIVREVRIIDYLLEMLDFTS